jgi:drug/metabolite transporter (DMT)-like permease
VTVALGLTTALLWALTDLCNLVMTRRAGPYAGAFCLLTCGIVPLAPAALIAEDWPAHVPADAVAAALVAGVLDAVAVLCLLRALAVGSLTLVAPPGGARGRRGGDRRAVAARRAREAA